MCATVYQEPDKNTPKMMIIIYPGLCIILGILLETYPLIFKAIKKALFGKHHHKVCRLFFFKLSSVC